MSDTETELVHYGVPGMKWGRRKRTSGRSAKQARASKLHKEIKDLSDSELRARIARIQMEKQYMQLSSPPSKASAGKKMAQELLVNTGKQIAAEALKKGITSGAKVAFSAAKSAATKK